jgi:hypothetical protein
MAQQEPKNLPNYQHPDYAAMAEPLKVLLDVYNNLEGEKQTYLIKESREPDQAFQQRVRRSTFSNKLRPIVESNAGLLTAFELNEAPATIDAAQSNIDQKGADTKAFFQEADTLALRDNYCYVMVDYPPNSGDIITEADRLQSNRRPYLVLIDRRNVLNWRTHFENGELIIDQATIQMQVEQPDGNFGVSTKTQYHQLIRAQTPEGWRVEHKIWEIKAGDNGEQIAVMTDRSLTTLEEIPLVCYPYTFKPFNSDIPPFLKAARLNIKLFRQESNLDEIQYRVNVPTVWRKHPTVEVPANLPPVTFGANWIIEIPHDGDVGVLEISGSGIEALQHSIERLSEEIENEGLGFLAGGRVQRTATEAFLSSSQVQASLSGMARHKQSAIERIFQIWCEYTGEESTLTAKMDANLLDFAIDGQEMGVLLQYWVQGVISHETLLELMVSGKQLPPGFDVRAEIKKVEAERARQMAAQQPAMEQLLGLGQGEQNNDVG